jgi:hypothetical protein
MGCVHSVIEDKFSCGEVSSPIILLSSSEKSKVLLHLLISVLGLAVELGMVCSSKGMSDAKSLMQCLHKMCGELRAMI